MLFIYVLDLNLRRSEAEIGGRLDYDQPECALRHS